MLTYMEEVLMKFLLRTLRVALMLVLLFTSLLSAEPLKLATTYWPPYTEIHNAKVPGVFVEVVREIFSQMNQEITMEEFPWKRSQFYAEHGKVDAIFAAAYTEERARYAIYPQEALGSLDYVFFLPSADLGTFSFHSADDLKDLKIGVIDGAAVVKIPLIAESAEKWQNISAIAGEDSESRNMLVLDRGLIDCYAGSLLTGQAMIRQLKGQGHLTSDLKPYLDKPLQQTDVFLIFSKKAGYTAEHPIVTAFTQALEKFKQTEKYQSIIQKYSTSQ